ncbi:MAG: hypothetical protein EA376_12195 [Phycisphaeraceae bacterium]|nr:MAG: hypothetical protein EA376_12195 [Phycisphaeraceae bacterium]
MSTSKNTFTQVRDILKKIDQSIDTARAKRIQDEKGAGESDAQRRSPEEQRRHEGEGAHTRDDAAARPGRAMPKSTGGNGSSENPFQRRVG